MYCYGSRWDYSNDRSASLFQILMQLPSFSTFCMLRSRPPPPLPWWGEQQNLKAMDSPFDWHQLDGCLIAAIMLEHETLSIRKYNRSSFTRTQFRRPTNLRLGRIWQLSWANRILRTYNVLPRSTTTLFVVRGRLPLQEYSCIVQPIVLTFIYNLKSHSLI